MEILPFYSSDAISFIVGNKVDLDDEREVSYEEGKILANEYKTSFLETSALENINIKQVFESLAKQCLDNHIINENITRIEYLPKPKKSRNYC